MTNEIMFMQEDIFIFSQLLKKNILVTAKEQVKDAENELVILNCTVSP